ncbi:MULTISPECIES: helix-turn-helix domain-containing protein [Paenibacillus]|uniref:Helix-turn-helix transcriptional regulator n=1 Tax=Paenibacillus xylanilyticus TaxID=248903 RepID=A0A7Y6EXR4_9BACL|nr:MULTISPECIES: helix-turn-helix transcriptional regulator [Paenibacillus]MBE7682055.1 helix-turn-helix domain-containing protein [Paenibacillus sp. P13VS]MBM6385666.1 helix-turn-helix transcriptional regulator [Paenibacillus sp.]NUU77994.1 helix-turn-helix transcriptional regulator [Paenibacillus xylanilyticus]WJH28419.1 helix-turn-helix transcriptional regulator [Paenibacillus sp. CC-CFT742]
MGLEIEANIKRLIDKKEWTIYRLSKESGVAVSALYSIGKKKQGPYAETLVKLSNALGCTVDDLVRGHI